MGYRTYYAMVVTPMPAELEKNLKEIVKGLERGDFFEMALEYKGFGVFESSGEGCSWYEHEADLRNLSRQFPESLFVLHGEGEEREDVWDAYFKGGKCQREAADVTVNISGFDETKMS
jgi:hypothetical protein